MKFDLPKENSSIIKVLGVGGGGSNAVNHMYRQGITGVDFIVCNTDQQALDVSPVPLKVQLGATLTEGRGAGSLPDVGKNAAIENIDDLKDIVNKNTKMIFITAGMGGGTGTGAAPVIAKTAREMGVLTVGIVTMPFFFEGKKRRQQAEAGIEEIRQNVDTLLIINNEKLREMCGNLPIAQAFAMADDVLTTAARGIAEIITRTGYINVDFEDVRTVMNDSGVAIMGSAASEGEDRAIKAVEKALSSPLLNDNNIQGARYVLLNITFGNQEVLMDEISDITDYIQDEAGSSADVIWGYGMDEALGDQLSVTIIATGFNQNPNTGVNLDKKPEARKLNLEDEPETKTNKEANFSDADTTEDEPFLKRPMEEEASTPTQEMEEDETRYTLTDDADAKESEESDAEEKRSQRVFEFDVSSSEKDDPESKKDSEPFLKGSASESKKESSEDRKDWEPFKRESSEEKKPITQEKTQFKTTTPESNKKETDGSGDKPSREEQAERANARLSRLRELSMRLRTPSGMSDLENEPAFKRKQINLDDVPHSSESSMSKFTLGEEEDEDGEKRTKLRENNSFLHKNVD
ncbi:MAG: cell division protein FtsZ [Salibacteraceae bacterium]